MFIFKRWLIGLVLVLGAGCAHQTYFKVTDPQTGRIYYTRFIENYKGGLVQLKDGDTGGTVALQNPDVTEISPEDYPHQKK